MQRQFFYAINSKQIVKSIKARIDVTEIATTDYCPSAESYNPNYMLSNSPTNTATKTVLQAENLSVFYGNFKAVRDVDLNIYRNTITAFIGPSGCGKSTVLRCFNRLNDLIPGARIEGKITFQDTDLYDKRIDPVELRRRIGMVFQRPNPFPKSIYENIAFGARINGYRGNMDELVERSLQQAALWDEVKDKLKQSGLSLSGGQQQRLCIARALSTLR